MTQPAYISIWTDGTIFGAALFIGRRPTGRGVEVADHTLVESISPFARSLELCRTTALARAARRGYSNPEIIEP